MVGIGAGDGGDGVGCPRAGGGAARNDGPGDRGMADVALPPDKFNRLAANVAEKLSKAGERGIYPAVVTSSRRRRFLRTLLGARGLAAPGLSFDELGFDARPSIVGMVAA